MARLIDADALYEAVCRLWDKSDSEDFEKGVFEIIYNAPTIDAVEVVRGEWIIEKTLYDNYNYRCNNCDWYETHAYLDCGTYNFCPNCGARMKGADDE